MTGSKNVTEVGRWETGGGLGRPWESWRRRRCFLRLAVRAASPRQTAHLEEAVNSGSCRVRQARRHRAGSSPSRRLPAVDLPTSCLSLRSRISPCTRRTSSWTTCGVLCGGLHRDSRRRSTTHRASLRVHLNSPTTTRSQRSHSSRRGSGPTVSRSLLPTSPSS